MQVRQLFLADIGRDINPVIKVADYTEDELQNELEDYVVTDVIEKYLLDFLEHYTDTRQKQTDRGGVWISGYVGSGKSHFAKLLGLLAADVLAQKDVDRAIGDRAVWRADERRWCREGKLPKPGWWQDRD